MICNIVLGLVCVCVQLENQDSVRTLLKRTEAELNVRVADALRKQEDPLQRQRLLVEEERLKYLNEEELIIQQLQSVTVSALMSDSGVRTVHGCILHVQHDRFFFLMLKVWFKMSFYYVLAHISFIMR